MPATAKTAPTRAETFAAIKQICKRRIAEFEKAKTEFQEAFATNPTTAINYHGKAVVAGQTLFILAHRITNLFDKAYAEDLDALAEISKYIDQQEQGLIEAAANLNNSTCPFSNVVTNAGFQATATALGHFGFLTEIRNAIAETL